MLIIRISEDVSDRYVNTLRLLNLEYNISTVHFEANDEEEIKSALCSGTYDYIYFAGHGDESAFSNREGFMMTWEDLASTLCLSDALKENSTLMMYCCKGGSKNAVQTLMEGCKKISYVCGSMDDSFSMELLMCFSLFIYNVEYKKKDPLTASIMSSEATGAKFYCVPRVVITCD